MLAALAATARQAESSAGAELREYKNFAISGKTHTHMHTTLKRKKLKKQKKKKLSG